MVLPPLIVELEYEAADASFKLLLNRYLKGKRDDFELVGYRVMVGHQTALNRTVSEATVQVKVGDEVHHTVAEATGPVGALDAALRWVLAPHNQRFEVGQVVR